MASLRQLDQSERVTVISIGTSKSGRAIPQVTVAHPNTQFGQTARLFIIARQHGTEMAGTEAMMALINYLARAQGPSDLALLERVTFAIVPVSNPDGMVGSHRRNDANVDLNRDWSALSQPETQAIDWALRIWRPHAFIDCHELPASSSRASYQQSFVETIADDPVLDKNLTEFCDTVSKAIRYYETAYGQRLNVYYDSHDSDRRLAHRHVGLDYEIPSFLFESKTGSGHSTQERIKFHVIGTLVTANLLAQRVAAPAQAAPAPPEMRAPARPDMPRPPVEIPSMVVTVPPIQVPSTRDDAEEKLPEKTTLHFTSPGKDRLTFSDKIPLKVEVDQSADFAYLSIHVDGIMRTLTDAPPYEGSIAVENYESGPHTVVVRAHDGGGRVIADAQRTVIVNNTLAGP